MKLRRFVYLYLALWLAFPCIVFLIWMSDYNFLIGTVGTAFFIQSILNCAAAACGIFLAVQRYRKTEKTPKNKVFLVLAVTGMALILLCWNFLCAFLDGMEEYHSFSSPDGAHTIVIMEKIDGVSGQVLLYEKWGLFLIKPRERIITNNGYRPVCDGAYSLVWEGDTVTLSVSDRAGGNPIVSVRLNGQ